MGKRTSDFVALAAIVAGGGLGFGLTSLFAGAAPEVQVRDTSVEIRVVPGRVLIGPSSTVYVRSLARASASLARASASTKGLRVVVDRRREDVAELTDEAEKLLREARELRLDQSTTIDVLLDNVLGDVLLGNVNVLGRVEFRAGPNEDEDEDDRRRRRRRRPREEAEVRASRASGNR